MALEERLGTIVDLPLGLLERMFSEMAAAMTKAGDEAERLAGEEKGDEKFSKIIVMVHSRGIAAGLELAATELSRSRGVVQEAVDEMRAES